MDLHERLAGAREVFRRAGIGSDEAAIDAELLARHVLGIDRAALLEQLRDPEPPDFAERYQPLVARRVAREPMAYITGHREFWGLDFEVTGAVLIPRPETEFVVEQCLSLVHERSAVRRIVDVGTGSGCLAVALAHEFIAADVIATDVSDAALAVARRNAERLGVAPRVTLVRANLLDGLSGTFDLIVSNPPYVPEPDRAHLQVEVARFEPPVALFAGPSGLDVIHRLLRSAPARLAPGGLLVVEFGYGQETAVVEAAAAGQWEIAGIARDYQDIPRVAAFRR